MKVKSIFILLLVNLIAIFLFLFLSHHIYLYKKISKQIISIFNVNAKHKFYNKITDKIGILPSLKTSTAFQNIKIDPEKIKIGFFGDSHTAGDEVPVGHDFPTIVQRITGEKYQIINFGFSGYGFNQVYMMIDIFTEIFDLDYIVIGPRGFYKTRTNSFNYFWENGTLVSSRFILKDDKLVQLNISGKNSKEKSLNYISFFPSRNMIFHDLTPPSFLKLINTIFDKNIYNPFFTKKNKVKTRAIQIKQIKNIALKYNKPIIHYTDSKYDCNDFKKIRHKNYKLYCTSDMTKYFPYKARVSHPSSFGQLEHAIDIKNILINPNHRPKLNLAFKDNVNLIDIQITKADFFENNDLTLKLKINNKTQGTLEDLKWHGTNFNKIKNFKKDEVNYDKVVYIGVKEKAQLYGDSTFFKVPLNKENLNLLRKIKFKKIQGLKGFFFSNLAEYNISLNRSIFYFDQSKNKKLGKFLFKQVEINKNHHYLPKFSAYKIVINLKNDILSFNNNKNILLNYVN